MMPSCTPIYESAGFWSAVAAFLSLLISSSACYIAIKSYQFNKNASLKQTLSVLATRANALIKAQKFPTDTGEIAEVTTSLSVAADYIKLIENKKIKNEMRHYFWSLLHSSIWVEIDRQDTFQELQSQGQITDQEEIRTLTCQYNLAKEVFIDKL
ncbi:hypothetical protein G3M83_04370 [Rouxiella badensis]|uniref:hypothetical protein n=1 Tax=Rouxiella badensis TaxID=1646377 RepID=UPI0013EF34CA|nr:hypothetical protein [Rouxiella badensis]QII36979.1 hypothetical protein G3M83_04370 [Rouxiella badensis]